jgi:hypothetical protein
MQMEILSMGKAIMKTSVLKLPMKLKKQEKKNRSKPL